MRHDPLPPYQSEAQLALLPFAAADALLRAEAAEHGLELHSGHGRSTWCKVEGGEFGARMGPEGSILYARAHSREMLFSLQEAIVAHLAEALPEAAAALRWSSIDRPGAHPPNFSLARVAGISPVGADFLRLRLEAPDLHRFARQIIHFRLILQPPDAARPQWPVIGENGQTLWPQGRAALHRPAYTVRAIDAEAGWMETDIFVHAGGRVCAWAAEAAPGSQVGLTGPGGGGIPVAQSLLIAGDETAYPALARILAAQAPQASGECLLLGARDDYPLPAHPGIRVIHAPRGEAALADRLRREGCTAQQIWIATERNRLEPLKQAIARDPGIDRKRTHLAAYWTA